MAHAVRITSEVGRLRTVVLHRPGEELRRLTPRNAADLLFDAIPWVERAQAEHDAFASTLRARGVDVRYLSDLLTETLAASGTARENCVEAALPLHRIGPRLAASLRGEVTALGHAELADTLITGLTLGELGGFPQSASLLAAVGAPADFVIPPLPNTLFTRDTAAIVGDRVAVTSPALAARRREVTLIGAIWAHHPELAATPSLTLPAGSGLEGGDVLVLGEGVLAVGIGQRTSPAGAESLAEQAFSAGWAHTVLAVPIAQDRATMHLDTVCTMVDTDAVVMYPPVATSLEAWVLTPGHVRGPAPFLTEAAEALGLERIRVVDTGLDPISAEREQWEDGNNTLALEPGVVVAYERNVRTNARLAEAGIEVLAIAGSELGSGRGGPRCLSCPILRDPL